ncbi:hypothetical protein A2867_04035 [Candidatus Daviesbacteria bacterium RIFCSPHIGHO2_01_FULL_40_11]|uniref:Uncharacterized protein n=1 Tax=Candidatus Daviesbacteria bacterium RIFCSPHIGHO2_01_FULL_40_11 TaxID=1797762 RepID=A0A1F5JFY2_9BACT|nr:MAG: hypothetical protein A2867_04035 [Candidatus Daviesbacteria bacterium RIFCSPHIGHO2_01_FULL_40_11]
MEKLRPFFPGLGEKCGDCRKKLENPSAGSFCKDGGTLNGFVLKPKTEVGCDRYGPNLSAILKKLRGQIRPLITAIRYSLPE